MDEIQKKEELPRVTFDVGQVMDDLKTCFPESWTKDQVVSVLQAFLHFYY